MTKGACHQASPEMFKKMDSRIDVFDHLRVQPQPRIGANAIENLDYSSLAYSVPLTGRTQQTRK